jgi:hypothetical protein
MILAWKTPSFVEPALQAEAHRANHANHTLQPGVPMHHHRSCTGGMQHMAPPWQTACYARGRSSVTDGQAPQCCWEVIFLVAVQRMSLCLALIRLAS